MTHAGCLTDTHLFSSQEIAKAKILYAMEHECIAAVLCGPPGTGKTFMLQSLIDDLKSIDQVGCILSWLTLRETILSEQPDVLVIDSIDDANESELGSVIHRCRKMNPHTRFILVGTGRLLTLISRDKSLEKQIGMRAVLTSCKLADTLRLVAGILQADAPNGCYKLKSVADVIHEITAGIPGDIVKLTKLVAVVAMNHPDGVTGELIEQIHWKLDLRAA